MTPRQHLKLGDWVATDLGGLGTPDGHFAQIVSIESRGHIHISPEHPLTPHCWAFEWPPHWLAHACSPESTPDCPGSQVDNTLADRCRGCKSFRGSGN